jgi:alkylation response protein AidB-like acyl-CoA dehydrogenase
MSDRTSRQRVKAALRLDPGLVERSDDLDVGAAGEATRLLADIRELAPALAARAAEMEAERRIPHGVVEALKAIGAFRLFVPRSHGGLELDLPSGLAIIAALSRLDGSVG